MIGLSAVVMGGLWRDGGLPLPLAILITLLVGTAGGYLNAVMITKLRFPPLIVTLGTFSLFRGIAEGLQRHHTPIRMVAVEPSESAVLSGGPPGSAAQGERGVS